MKRFIVAAFFLMPIALMGQGVLGVGNFIHVVGNLDKSIEFYHDGLGLEMTGAPGPRAFSANAVVSSLYDAPGAQSRVASFKIPDSPMAVEIVEFQGLNATPVSPHFFDPGAITLTLGVEDLEATKTRLHRIKGLEWISASRNISVKVRDPDGIFVNLVRGKDVQVGISLSCGGSRQDDAVLLGRARVYGQQLTEQGSARLYVPGDGFPVTFADLKYVDRKAGAFGDSRSGVGRAAASCRRFRAVVKAMKDAGATVVSAGGEPVNLGRNRAVIFRGPDNLFVQVLEVASRARGEVNASTARRMRPPRRRRLRPHIACRICLCRSSDLRSCFRPI